MLMGHLLPMPWTSEVAPVEQDGGTYRLTYRQALGPYRNFEHTHWVSAGREGGTGSQGDREAEGPAYCSVEDSISASVLGEPILDAIAGMLLTWILRCRGDALTDR